MDYTEEFMLFWKAYPKRWNRDIGMFVKRKKYPAFQKWQKLSQAVRNECLAKSRLIRATEGTPRDCVTWLNQRGWDDIEIDEKPKPLPKELVPVMRTVEPIKPVNVNNARNRNMNALRGK